MIRATGVVLAAGMFASAAAANPVATPPPDAGPATEQPDPRAGVTPADSTDALTGYLDDLSVRASDDFLLRSLSISDAEVDSLMRVYERTGRAPGDVPATDSPPRDWVLDAGLAGMRYNRVEGVNVIGQASLRAPGAMHPEAFAIAGWGWAAKEPTWRSGLRLEVPGRAALEVAHAREVWAYGAGGVPGNSVLALTAGRDENDYYRGKGWTASLALGRGGVRGDVAWSIEDQESVSNETDFTLFDEGHRFRFNPPIQEGQVRRIAASVGAGRRADGRASIDVRGAIAGGGLGGDFDYESVGVTAVVRQRLWLGDELKLRLDGASLTGAPPYQALHFLGGAQRLRGYDVNEIGARRALHAALDYKVGTNPLGWLPYLRRIRVQPVPFFDAAAIFETQSPGGARFEPDRPDWRFDAGIGLQYNVLGIPGGSGQARLDVVRRLDRSEDSMTYRLGFTIER